MSLKEIKCELNQIYRINNLTYETYAELENLINSDKTLIGVDAKDFELISRGYEQLIIGFGKIKTLDSFLNLFKSFERSNDIIVNYTDENLFISNVSKSLDRIRDFFGKDINIIYSIDYKKEDYDIILFIPINKKLKEY